MVWLGLQFFHFASTPATALAAQFLVWVVPGAACAYVQFLVSRRAGVSRSRLWLQVAATGFGAPLLGVGTVLFVFLVVLNGSM